MESFNPHTHAGCDNTNRIGKVQGNSFNPHTHAGCDYKYDGITPTRQVSIHTPTQGVTFVWCASGCCHEVSIHTPTQGVTLLYTLGIVDRWFQSTHPRRV